MQDGQANDLVAIVPNNDVIVGQFAIGGAGRLAQIVYSTFGGSVDWNRGKWGG